MVAHRKAFFITDLAAEFKREAGASDVAGVEQVQFIDQGFTFIPELSTTSPVFVPADPATDSDHQSKPSASANRNIGLAATVQLHLPHHSHPRQADLRVRKLVIVSILFLLASVLVIPILHFIFNHQPQQDTPFVIQVAPGAAPGMRQQGVREYHY